MTLFTMALAILNDHLEKHRRYRLMVKYINYRVTVVFGVWAKIEGMVYPFD